MEEESVQPQTLSPEETAQLLRLLEQIGEPRDSRIFNAIAGMVVLTGLEAAIFRWNAGSLEILLHPRPADDPNWPGQWHMPGTILRAADAPAEQNVGGLYSTAFRRIEERELGGHFLRDPQLVDSYFHRAERGVVNSLIFVCQVADDVTGTYFPVDELPTNIIECHCPMIKIAAAAFKTLFPQE